MAKTTDLLYIIPDNPVYNPNIRELQNADPANAETVFNPLFSKIINNVHAVKLAEDVEKAKADRHIAYKTNPHAVSKTQVGLGNVDNIKQAAKAEFDGHVGNVDIHTSAGEKARLEQELGGKVTARTQAISSWDQLIKSSSGYYLITPMVVGMPIVNAYWNCQIISDERDISGYYSRTFIVFMVNNGEPKYQIPWIKNIVNGDDYGWFQLAGALSPQEFDIPFLNGIKARAIANSQIPFSTYCKNQLNQVTVNAWYERSGTTDDIGNTESIFQLPVGYRPLKEQEFEATVFYGGQPKIAYGVVVNTNGIVNVYLYDNSSYQYGKFNFTFTANH